jgi:hypothetical protein
MRGDNLSGVLGSGREGVVIVVVVVVGVVGVGVGVIVVVVGSGGVVVDVADAGVLVLAVGSAEDGVESEPTPRCRVGSERSGVETALRIPEL